MQYWFLKSKLIELDKYNNLAQYIYKKSTKLRQNKLNKDIIMVTQIILHYRPSDFYIIIHKSDTPSVIPVKKHHAIYALAILQFHW